MAYKLFIHIMRPPFECLMKVYNIAWRYIGCILWCCHLNSCHMCIYCVYTGIWQYLVMKETLYFLFPSSVYFFSPLFHCLTVIFIVYMLLLIFWIFCRQLLQKSFLTSQCEDIIIWTCLNSPCPYKLQQRSRCDLWCDKEGAYNEMLGFWDHILVYSWQNVLKTWIKWAKVMLKKRVKSLHCVWSYWWWWGYLPMPTNHEIKVLNVISFILLIQLLYCFETCLSLFISQVEAYVLVSFV